MAAAIVPLVASLIPTLAPVAISLVQAVEKAFGAKAGTQKKQTVVETLGSLVGSLNPTIPQAASALTDLNNLVELVVSLLKSQGQLGAPAPPPSSPQGSTSYTLTGQVNLAPPAASGIQVSGG